MYDLIIIGSGMAGMTAAIYALRNNKSVLILEKESVGGQIAKSPKVENFPTKKQISGAQLSDEVFDQVMSLGVNFELETVSQVTKENNLFYVKTDYNTHIGKSVIIATGASPRRLGLENEDKFTGHGIYNCAICDGPFFVGQEVTLIGDANSALQYALMLASYCSKVHILTLFDKFFGEKTLIEAVKNSPKIDITHNMKAIKLNGNDSLESVTFQNEKGELIDYKTNACFVAIGQVPDNTPFEKLVTLDKDGYVVSNEDCTTDTEGLFVAGDCRTKAIRQVTTAVGDGAVAGTRACRYISKLKG